MDVILALITLLGAIVLGATIGVVAALIAGDQVPLRQHWTGLFLPLQVLYTVILFPIGTLGLALTLTAPAEYQEIVRLVAISYLSVTVFIPLTTWSMALTWTLIILLGRAILPSRPKKTEVTDSK